MAWLWPSTCKVISQGYGVKNPRYVKGYHTGIDIACPNGSPVRAVADGKITSARYNGPYGNQVKQQIGSAEVWYNHFNAMVVKAGDQVSAGTILGYEGSTGQSTGPHLHFEVRIDGKDVDPMPYLDGSKIVPAGDVTPAVDIPGSGVVDSLKSVAELVKLLTDPVVWMRIGMFIGGGILVLLSAVGLAKAQVLGKTVVNKVVKTGGKS